MENQPDLNKEQLIENPAAPAAALQIDQGKLNQYLERLKLEQNLPLGFLAGAVACLAGAGLWALITVITEYQIGYMAVAVGLMVGFAIRYAGKGIDQIFGIMGAGLSLIGCLLGNFLSMVGFAANSENVGFIDTLVSIDVSVIPQVMMDTFSPIDLLFYGLAIYEGYKFSFRPITEEEVAKNAV